MASVPCPAVMKASGGTVQVLVTPVTGGTLKLTVVLLQTFVGPLMVPGVEGDCVSVTASWLGVLVPQLFPAVTATFPEVVPHMTVMEVVFCPDWMMAPAGTVQL